MRKVFEIFGVCDQLVADGGKQFASSEFEMFAKRWDMNYHQTSAYQLHSNLQAETGVKSVKKIVMEHCNKKGNLNSDAFSIALLQYRNTSCRYLNQSPAQILCAQRLKDGLPCVPGALKMRQAWIKT